MGRVRQVVAIGASMGGIDALESLIARLPGEMPPILIVQHILPAFTSSLAARLNGAGAIRVVEAQEGACLTPGVAYLAPAHRHLLVRSIGGELRVVLSSAPPVRFHRPSVDALFTSLVALDSVDVVAALLSGMGSDGAEGLLALRHRGAQTIVQDKSSSVMFGMAKEAIARGAAGRIVSLDELPAAILASLGVSSPRLSASRRRISSK